MQTNKEFIAYQLSFDKEIHGRKLECLSFLLTEMNPWYFANVTGTVLDIPLFSLSFEL